MAKARGMDIPQHQIFGEGVYATLERQCLYENDILDLCYAAQLNTWKKIGEAGKKIGTFTRVI